MVEGSGYRPVCIYLTHNQFDSEVRSVLQTRNCNT